MADNFNINQAESGTLTVMAADLISDVLYPRVKAGHGADGSYSDTSNTEPMPVKIMPYTSGGPTPYHLKAAATTNLTSLKSSPGQIYSIQAFNAAATTKYLKLYDKATAPAPASDTPINVYPLEAGKMTTINFFQGKEFAVGIAFSITGGVGNTDTTALAANDVILNMEYE